MSLADIERRLGELNNRTHELLVEAAAAGDPNHSSDLLREIMNEAAALKEQRTRITEQRQSNAQAARRMEDAVAAMEQLPCEITQWDEPLIRQLVNTVKVNSAEKITVYLADGTQIEQDMIS